MALDTLVEQTMEPYLYTGNNLIMFADPTGMNKVSREDLICDKKQKNTIVMVASISQTTLQMIIMNMLVIV